MKPGPKPKLKSVKHLLGQDQLRDFSRVERLREKALKVATLNDLVVMHEASAAPDLEYIRRLKKRYREEKQQLSVMRP